MTEAGSEPAAPIPAPHRPWLLAWLPFVLPLLLILVADRATKWWVRETLWEPPRTVIVVPNWLELTPVANRGIAFGLLQESGGILALVAVVTLGFIALRNWRQVLGAPVLFRIALGLIGGGALGNLIDRVQIGYVTDFIRVPRIALFQVFNIADAAIVVGTVTLVFALWQSEERARRRHSDPAPQADAPGVE